MKITIEPSEPQQEIPVMRHCKISIEHPNDDLTLTEVMEMIQSALIAWGFHPSLFEEK